MADVGIQSRPSEGQNNHVITPISEVLSKHINNFELSVQGKVKWMGNLDSLKRLIIDLFGDKGRWSSSGGAAKAFRNDHLSITWYSNKNTLIFQGDAGIKLKEQIIGLLERKDCIVNSVEGPEQEAGTTLLKSFNTNDEQRYTDCSSSDASIVEQSIKDLHATVNQLFSLLSLITSNVALQNNGVKSNREIGIQTEPLKVGETIIENPSGMQNSYSELSTELEGVKLDLVIMESKIMGSVCSNTKAMDQIRSDMAALHNEQSEMKMMQQSQHAIRTCENKHKNASKWLETIIDENIIDINKAETNKNANIEQQPKAYNSNKNTPNNNTNYIFSKQQTKAINPICVEPHQANLK